MGTAACSLLAAANAASSAAAAAAGGAARLYGLSASARLGGSGQEQYALLYDSRKWRLEQVPYSCNPYG